MIEEELEGISGLGRPVEILLVEDNPADYRLTMEALKDGRLANNLSHVTNGVEAMRFLRRQGEYVKAPRPDLVLLDLNLPQMDGREVLAEVKSDTELNSIPVVILTTSRAEEDILRTYGLHANCYVVKPIGLDQFLDVVRSIESFWFCIVKLPTALRGKIQ